MGSARNGRCFLRYRKAVEVQTQGELHSGLPERNGRILGQPVVGQPPRWAVDGDTQVGEAMATPRRVKLQRPGGQCAGKDHLPQAGKSGMHPSWVQCQGGHVPALIYI